MIANGSFKIINGQLWLKWCSVLVHNFSKAQLKEMCDIFGIVVFLVAVLSKVLQALIILIFY